MAEGVYRELLEVMKSRGGPYAGLDIPEFFALVVELFEPEEAEINNALPRKPTPINEISTKAGRSYEKVSGILERMAGKGLCGVSKTSDNVLYRGLPFMPGIFEFIFIGGGESEWEKTVARLIHTYKKAYAEFKGVEKITYPLTRVIPVARTIKAGNTIHTYDQVMTYIHKYDVIGVGACYCRQAAKLRGEELHGMPDRSMFRMRGMRHGVSGGRNNNGKQTRFCYPSKDSQRTGNSIEKQCSGAKLINLVLSNDSTSLKER